MTLDQLANIGELLGGVAVIVSLIYVAVQIRQNTKSVRAQSELVMNQRFADWHGRANEHPELSRVWDAAAENWEEMSDEEIRRYRWFIAELFLIYEACFQLYRQGDIGDLVWGSKMDALKVLLRNPVVLGWWESRMTPMSEEFRNHLEALIPTESAWQHISIAADVNRDNA